MPDCIGPWELNYYWNSNSSQIKEVEVLWREWDPDTVKLIVYNLNMDHAHSVIFIYGPHAHLTAVSKQGTTCKNVTFTATDKIYGNTVVEVKKDPNDSIVGPIFVTAPGLTCPHSAPPLLSCDPWFSRHPHCGHKCCDFSWGPAPAQLTSPCVFVKNMRCVEILTLNFTWIQTNRHWHGAGRWFVAVIDNELTDVLEECFQHHYWSGFDDFSHLWKTLLDKLFVFCFEPNITTTVIARIYKSCCNNIDCDVSYRSYDIVQSLPLNSDKLMAWSISDLSRRGRNDGRPLPRPREDEDQTPRDGGGGQGQERDEVLRGLWHGHQHQVQGGHPGGPGQTPAHE